jgi:hypothetical protein
VQGCNGQAIPIKVFRLDGKLYGPIRAIEYPSEADKKEELRLEALRIQKERFTETVYKAKQLGLADEDLAILLEGINHEKS